MHLTCQALHLKLVFGPIQCVLITAIRFTTMALLQSMKSCYSREERFPVLENRVNKPHTQKKCFKVIFQTFVKQFSFALKSHFPSHLSAKKQICTTRLSLSNPNIFKILFCAMTCLYISSENSVMKRDNEYSWKTSLVKTLIKW